MLKIINKQPRTTSCSNTNLDETRYVYLKWYVVLYPECRPYYRPFGIGYGIYVRVSIRYTTKGEHISRSSNNHIMLQTTLMR